MKDDDPEIATAQNPKILDRGVAVLEQITKTFTDSILKGVVHIDITRILYDMIEFLTHIKGYTINFSWRDFLSRKIIC